MTEENKESLRQNIDKTPLVDNKINEQKDTEIKAALLFCSFFLSFFFLFVFFFVVNVGLCPLEQLC